MGKLFVFIVVSGDFSSISARNSVIRDRADVGSHANKTPLTLYCLIRVAYLLNFFKCPLFFLRLGKMRDMVITIAYIFNIFRMTDLRVSHCLVEYYFRVLFTLCW